jgi:hypothetical protein
MKMAPPRCAGPSTQDPVVYLLNSDFAAALTGHHNN